MAVNGRWRKPKFIANVPNGRWKPVFLGKRVDEIENLFLPVRQHIRTYVRICSVASQGIRSNLMISSVERPQIYSKLP